MGDIVKSLKYLEFPECTKQALKFLATSLSSSSAGDGKYIADVCQDYILFRRTSQRKQLNPIQELQLLELLCNFLEELQDGVRTAAFAFIFGGRVNSNKVELLTKLVSLGISVHSKPVLDSVADWIQDHGCDSEHVLTVTKALVQDHCVLFPEMTSAFRTLPSISPLLACNIMCSVTCLYTYTNKDQRPPELLVRYVTDWLKEDPSLSAAAILTFSSPHLITESSNRYCPVAGLLQWCSVGPLVEMTRSHNGINSINLNSHDNVIFTLFSQLHLALLNTLLSFSHEHCQLLTVSNIECVVKQFVNVSKELRFEEDIRQFAAERIGQAVQVAVASRNLTSSSEHLKTFNFFFAQADDLSKVMKSLLPNRLVELVLRELGAQGSVPMDVS